MERVKDYLFLHLSVMMFSFTSVFSKLASRELNAGGLKNPMLYVFGFLMFFVCFLYAFCWQKIIKKLYLNIGYANRSVYLLWSQLWAVMIFKEQLSGKNIIGLMIVMAGVVVVSLSAPKENEQGGEPV